MSEIKIEDLQTLKANSPIDVTKHEGKRVKIEIVQVEDSFSSYDEKGKYTEGLKRPVKRLKVESEVLENITKTDGTPLFLRASALFGLSKEIVNGQEVWGVRPHKNSKLWNFMKKQKVNTIPELKGTVVTVTTRASSNPEDDREYLGFAI